MTQIKNHCRHLLVAAGLIICSCGLAWSFGDAYADPANDTGAWHAAGTHGAVVAGGKEAVDAGMIILRSGGNAADAAVATLLALTVTDSAGGFCFGGEVPILVHERKRGTVEVVCGQGAAPRLATREYFEKKGGIPGSGPETAAIPGAFDACLTTLDRYGTRTFTQVVMPTLRILDRHERIWHADLARTIRRLLEAEKLAVERSQGLRLVADYFYRGPLARELDAWSRANGGLIRYTDLATHVTRIEEPVWVDYRGYRVYKCGPWTQGPCLLQTLRLLEGFDLKSMGQNRSDSIHVAVEAMKLALADRDTYYGDPLFADVPLRELLASSYTELRRGLINMRSASLERRPGYPAEGKALLKPVEDRMGTGAQSHDTTTCLVADRWGNVVAATPSGWGGVVAGNTGVYLGTRLISFNTWRDHPNCIAPGKRPRVTVTPTLVLKDDRPVLAVSVAGGDMQDQATLQLLLNSIEFGLAPSVSVTTPRFYTKHFVGSFHQAPPEKGSLYLQPEIGHQIADELKSRGHTVGAADWSWGYATVLSINPKSGRIEVAGDPKCRRHAAAF